MYRIVKDNADLPGMYHTEMEAYGAMSRLADEANEAKATMLVSFPVRIEVTDGKGNTIHVFRIINMHSNRGFPNLRASSQNMTVEDILRLLDFENAGKLLKESKPPLDERKELWVPTTSKGTQAYLKLLDILFSVGKITGTTDEMDEIVRKLDEAAEDTVNVEEDMNTDWWEELDNAVNASDISHIESGIMDSGMTANAKDELLRYADERRECFK